MKALGWRALPVALLLYDAGPARGQAPERGSAVAAHAMAARSSVSAAGEPFSIWITFDNVSGEAVSDLRFLDLQTPGFQTDGPCWVFGAPACSLGSSGQVAAPWRLGAGQALTLRAALRPVAGEGEYTLQGVYSWKDARGVEHQAQVRFAPLHVRARTRVLDVLFPLSGWLLALVAALKLCVDWLNQGRSERQQALGLMMAQSQRNAEKFYVPMAGAAGRLVHTASTGAPAYEVYFDLLGFLGHGRDLLHETGGFYLRQHRGEKLVARLWNAFRLRAEQQLGRRGLDGALDEFGKLSGLAAFAEKLEGARGYGSALLAPEAEALDMLRPLPADLEAILKTFRLVLLHETERAFEKWQLEPRPFPVEELETIGEKLPRELAALLKDYVALEKRAKRG